MLKQKLSNLTLVFGTSTLSISGGIGIGVSLFINSDVITNKNKTTYHLDDINLFNKSNEKNIGENRAFAISSDAWTTASLNNMLISPIPYDTNLFKVNMTMTKSDFLLQLDQLQEDSWPEDQWMTLADANKGTYSHSQPLVDNVKLGLGAKDKNGNMQFGNINFNGTCGPGMVPLPFNCDTPTYALNDVGYDSMNKGEDLSRDDVGNTWIFNTETKNFGWSTTLLGYFEWKILCTDENGNLTNFYKAIEIQQHEDDYGYSIRTSKNITLKLECDFIRVGDWENYGPGFSDKNIQFIIDGNGEPQEAQQQYQASQQIVNDTMNIINPSICFTGDECKYFDNNPTMSYYTINLDEKHLILQKFDGAYVCDESDGKSSLCWFLLTHSAQIVPTLYIFKWFMYWPVPDWPEHLKKPMIDLKISNDAPLLTIYNFDNGFKDGDYQMNISLSCDNGESYISSSSFLDI